MTEILFWLHEANDPEYRQEKFFILLEKQRGTPGWNTEATSISNFFPRELQRAFPDVTSGLDWASYAKSLKYCTAEWHDRSIDRVLDSLEIDRSSVPTFTSVWDVYKAIGYDYKKKCYI
jgi:hypothetical protein